MKKISERKAFILVYVAFLISALSVWLIPLAYDKTDHLSTIGYLTGAMFWIGMIAGIAGYFLFFGKEYGKPNIKRIFKNIPAITADIIFVMSLGGTIYCAIHFNTNQVIAELLMFLLITSVYSHFLLNGKVFQHIYGKEIEIQRTQEKGVR
ncbi:MAG: hypothetical protein PHN80_10775 [Hespellia sp.]|nr:hypothetical protein [Hespellia sp.]